MPHEDDQAVSLVESPEIVDGRSFQSQRTPLRSQLEELEERVEMSVSRSQAVDIISYAQALKGRNNIQAMVNAELGKLTLTDDAIGQNTLEEIARACGVEDYIEQARRVMAPTITEQYQDIFKAGGKIVLDQYKNWYIKKISSLVQQALGLEEKNYELHHGHQQERRDGSWVQAYDGYSYFHEVEETVTIEKKWFSIREIRKKERKNYGGIHSQIMDNKLEIFLHSDSASFTARIHPIIEPLNNNFKDLLARGGYDPQATFSFSFEARYLPI